MAPVRAHFSPRTTTNHEPERKGGFMRRIRTMSRDGEGIIDLSQEAPGCTERNMNADDVADPFNHLLEDV